MTRFYLLLVDADPTKQDGTVDSKVGPSQSTSSRSTATARRSAAPLISRTMSCKEWNLSRNTKRSLPKLKDIGDKSAHSRRFVAHRGDMERIIPDLRVVVQELIYVADLK